jgi:hypothetical protein
MSPGNIAKDSGSIGIAKGLLIASDAAAARQ